MGVEKLTKSVKSKQEIAYIEIKNLILSNQLLPGTVLFEQRLSEMLGISRTPVRAAMRDLANDNYISFVPGQGTVVSQIRIEDIIEIYELRVALDALSLRIFLKREDKRLIDQMKGHLEEMKTNLDEEDYQNFVFHDMAFHDSYLKNTGNSRLENINASLHDQIRRFLNLTASDAEKCRESYNDHKKVMDAIENNDYMKAEAVLKEHIVLSKSYHIRKLTKMQMCIFLTTDVYKKYT